MGGGWKNGHVAVRARGGRAGRGNQVGKSRGESASGKLRRVGKAPPFPAKARSQTNRRRRRSLQQGRIDFPDIRSSFSGAPTSRVCVRARFGTLFRCVRFVVVLRCFDFRTGSIFGLVFPMISKVLIFDTFHLHILTYFYYPGNFENIYKTYFY